MYCICSSIQPHKETGPRVEYRKCKGSVSVRLDPLVLDWLRGQGEGHLTRINDILTNRMEAERRTGSGR
jgi:uncharacterized protein (DUF4415 family)